MLYLLRHLTSILLLPFTATVIIPLWLLSSDPNPASAPQLATARVLVLAAGTAALILGLTLFISTVLHFVRTGRGTLAPWDPPRVLVVQGVYRYVRNPMISGVLFILFAEALLTGSMREITPLVGIGDNEIGSGKPGPVTKRLIAEYRRIVERECAPFRF